MKGEKIMRLMEKIGQLLDIDVSGLAIPEVKMVETTPENALPGTLAYWANGTITVIKEGIMGIADRIENDIESFVEELLVHELVHHVSPPTGYEVRTVFEVSDSHLEHAAMRQSCIIGLLAPWELRAEWVTEQLCPGSLDRMAQLGRQFPINVVPSASKGNAPFAGWIPFEDEYVWISASTCFSRHVARFPFSPEEIDTLANSTIPQGWETGMDGSVRRSNNVRLFEWAGERWDGAATELCGVAKAIKELS